MASLLRPVMATSAPASNIDSAMAKQMKFAARWGAACGLAFDAQKYLSEQPQFEWMKDILKSRPSQDWTVFAAGELSQ